MKWISRRSREEGLLLLRLHRLGDGNFLVALEGDNESIGIPGLDFFQQLFGRLQVILTPCGIFPEISFKIAVHFRNGFEAFVGEGDFFGKRHKLDQKADTVGVSRRSLYRDLLDRYFRI